MAFYSTTQRVRRHRRPSKGGGGGARNKRRGARTARRSRSAATRGVGRWSGATRRRLRSASFPSSSSSIADDGNNGGRKVAMYGVFHMNSCIHCQEFMPVWKKWVAKNEFADIGGQESSFDINENGVRENITHKFEAFGIDPMSVVHSYPTLYKVVDNKLEVFSDGNRGDLATVKAWLKA